MGTASGSCSVHMAATQPHVLVAFIARNQKKWRQHKQGDDSTTCAVVDLQTHQNECGCACPFTGNSNRRRQFVCERQLFGDPIYAHTLAADLAAGLLFHTALAGWLAG